MARILLNPAERYHLEVMNRKIILNYQDSPHMEDDSNFKNLIYAGLIVFYDDVHGKGWGITKVGKEYLKNNGNFNTKKDD